VNNKDSEFIEHYRKYKEIIRIRLKRLQLTHCYPLGKIIHCHMLRIELDLRIACSTQIHPALKRLDLREEKYETLSCCSPFSTPILCKVPNW
jgi:hypothetical protein